MSLFAGYFTTSLDVRRAAATTSAIVDALLRIMGWESVARRAIGTATDCERR